MKFSELQRLQRREGTTVLSADERIEQLEARLRAVTKERDALRARIEQMERQEPVAWRTFDGEGGYDYRNVADNEDYQAVWEARNPSHKGWVEPLYLTPGAQPEPIYPDFRSELSRLLETADHLYNTGEGEEAFEAASLAAFNALAKDARDAAIRARGES